VDLVATQTALKAWARALLGLASNDPVLFENEPRVMFNRVLVLLSWVSGAGVGVDETRYEDSGATAPAANMVPVLTGARVAVLQVAVETLSQAPDAPNARALCERLRDRLRRPSSLAALKAANLGLIDAQVITVADAKRDQRFNARAVVEVRFNATSFDRDADGAVSSIERVVLTSHVAKPDGAQLPAELQMTAEEIPPP
jgi:hypothetical protein